MVTPNKGCRRSFRNSCRLSIVSTMVSTRVLTSGIILIQEKQVGKESLTEAMSVEIKGVALDYQNPVFT